jgi:hypothetical protein
MATYGDMQTRIADELINESITTAQIKLAIQDAIGMYENMSFWFNQKKAQTFSTVALQEYYTATELSDIPYITKFYGMDVTNSGTQIQMNPADFLEIDQQQTGSITGLPRSWAYFNQKIRMYPIPDAVYTITLNYTYKLATLSADADTNVWMVEAENLIRLCAKRILARDIYYSEKAEAKFDKGEQEAYDDLRQQTRQMLGKSTLSVPSPLVGQEKFNIYRGW